MDNISVITNIVLASLTAIYVWLTHRMLKAAKAGNQLGNLRITSNLPPFLNRVRNRTEIRGQNPLFV